MDNHCVRVQEAVVLTTSQNMAHSRQPILCQVSQTGHLIGNGDSAADLPVVELGQNAAAIADLHTGSSDWCYRR